MHDWISLLELPFLFLAIFFAFRTAGALKGGIFGRGMVLLAWSFVIMGIGHLNMLSSQLFEFDLITTVFGVYGGYAVWVIALTATWTLSWLGFQSLYNASKGKGAFQTDQRAAATRT